MARGKRPEPNHDPDYNPPPKPEREDDAHVEKRPDVKAYNAPEQKNVMSWTFISTLIVFAILVVIFIIYAF